jgi:TetR/AcrR family transcriptional regulator
MLLGVETMYDNFEKLSEEKKKLIIDACLDEFARNGYDKASTNNIVREAGISKGILFHYFGNKKNLYLYILDYCTDYYIDYLRGNIKEISIDFFERILHLTELRLDISAMYPQAYQIFANAYLDIPADLRDEIDLKYHKLLELNNTLVLKNVDMTKFKEDIDTEKAIELIFMTFNGLIDKYVQLYKHFDDKGKGIREETFKELKQYVVIMKLAFYK